MLCGTVLPVQSVNHVHCTVSVRQWQSCMPGLPVFEPAAREHLSRHCVFLLVLSMFFDVISERVAVWRVTGSCTSSSAGRGRTQVVSMVRFCERESELMRFPCLVTAG